MNDYFYIIGIVFIAILTFHAFTMRKEALLKEHKEHEKILTTSKSPQEWMSFIKKHLPQIIISLLIYLYIIIGIASSEQKALFSFILIFCVGSSYAPYFTKNNKIKYLTDIIAHIVATLLLALAVYRHFYILTA